MMAAPLDPAHAQMIAALPRLRRFARALARNPADADDLVQDAVERALKNLDRWTPGTRMDSWMFRIIQNLWIDNVRARRIRGQSVGIEAADPAPFDGERAAEARLTLAKTQEAIAELPEDQRAVVAMVLIDGMSYREAAAVLEVPIGTVTSRLARARDVLAARILGEGKLGAVP